MIDDLKNDAQMRMIKTLESLKTELAKIRTGRAHPSLLEHLTVEYYGSTMPLSQVASVSATDARTLSITPWEKTMVQAIEKAIMTSDLGLNPATSGTTIRVPMPALTEERRRDLTKVVRQEGEAARVAIRNIRRDINSDLKNSLKDKVITEDDERRGNDLIQKMTDKYIQEVDKALEVKEADLMAV